MDTPTSQPYTPTPAPAPMTPPVTPVPVPVSSGPRSNKGIIAAVVVAVLLMGGYLAWAMTADSWPFAPSEPVATPTTSPSPTATPDPTAGWQTYTNAEFGFEVKHPVSWLVASGSGQISFTSPETKAITDANAIACNDVSDKTPCNPEIVAVDVVFSATSDEVASGSENEVMFNGISFTEYEAVSLYGEKHYKTTHDGATLDFTAYDRPILNQILSTFRFTD